MPFLKPFFQEGTLEAGVDEAGRGCLAGPVVAAAVILPPGFEHPLLNDSKQLTAAQRRQVQAVIEEKALAWALGAASPGEIDRINILQASLLAMHRAIDALPLRPHHLLIDGKFFNPHTVPHTCFVKGDATFASIAAASVMAKTIRDALMHAWAGDYPHYGWHTNAGYPTRQHYAGLGQYGPTPLHRLSFNLKPSLKFHSENSSTPVEV